MPDKPENIAKTGNNTETEKYKGQPGMSAQFGIEKNSDGKADKNGQNHRKARAAQEEELLDDFFLFFLQRPSPCSLCNL
jgi:hypothetical protein